MPLSLQPSKNAPLLVSRLSRRHGLPLLFFSPQASEDVRMSGSPRSDGAALSRGGTGAPKAAHLPASASNAAALPAPAKSQQQQLSAPPPPLPVPALVGQQQDALVQLQQPGLNTSSMVAIPIHIMGGGGRGVGGGGASSGGGAPPGLAFQLLPYDSGAAGFYATHSLGSGGGGGGGDQAYGTNSYYATNSLGGGGEVSGGGGASFGPPPQQQQQAVMTAAPPSFDASAAASGMAQAAEAFVAAGHAEAAAAVADAHAEVGDWRVHAQGLEGEVQELQQQNQ